MVEIGAGYIEIYIFQMMKPTSWTQRMQTTRAEACVKVLCKEEEDVLNARSFDAESLGVGFSALLLLLACLR